MNLPNKLTVLRLILVPVFFCSYLLSKAGVPALRILSTVLMLASYAIAELSDLLDGKIARKYHMVTDLGKVMDPFADTLTHLSYFVCFIDLGIMPVWCFIIIMWREFSILFLRMLMMRAGKAVPANIWGKSKTCLYAASAALSILYIVLAAFVPGGYLETMRSVLYVLFVLSALASFLSFTTYLHAIFQSKALASMTR